MNAPPIPVRALAGGEALGRLEVLPGEVRDCEETYGQKRRPEPRWAARIHAALGDARTVVNVGAGTGSYEPADRTVIAVEPSRRMIDQRPTGAAPAVRAVAEALPLPDDAVDAALAVFAVHHWRDPIAGLAEMRRVARRQVVVTWHPGMFSDRFWFVRDYLPQVAAHEAALATLDTVTRQLQATAIVALPVPADCTDGFFGAYWSRPHAYLDSGVRAAISALALLDQDEVAAAVSRLAADLASGRWGARYHDLLDLVELDLGYRLVLAG